MAIFWTQKQDIGASARMSPALAYDALHDRVVVFGGDPGGAPLADTWQWDGKLWTRFSVHPIQKDDSTAVTCLARVADIRTVSNPGRRQRRLVIRTDVSLGGETWPIDLTLTDRDEMGFRMLLGRTAMHGAMTVDPDHSYLLGKKKRVKRKKKKKKTGKPARKAKATTTTPGKAKAPKRRKKLGRLLQLFT